MYSRIHTWAAGLLLSLALVSTPFSVKAQELRDVMTVLERFQEGYLHRDTAMVESFVGELFAEEILIVGTGNSEWAHGRSQVADLVRWDWLWWGDLALQLDDAVASTEGAVAWFAVPGTSTRVYASEEEIYERHGVADLRRILDQASTNKAKLLAAIVDAGELIQEVEAAGSTFVYPLRVVGTMVRRSEGWRIRQMNFSYPFPRRLVLPSQILEGAAHDWTR